MTNREAKIKSLVVFIPVLSDKPLTHRYWFFLNGDNWKEKVEQGAEIDQDIANLIIDELNLKVSRMKDMTDEEHDNSNCDKIACVLFHNPKYPVLVRDNNPDFPGTLQQVNLIEDDKGGHCTLSRAEDTLGENILEKHILYGDIVLLKTKDGIKYEEIN